MAALLALLNSPITVAGCDQAVLCTPIICVAFGSPTGPVSISGSVTSPKSSGVLQRVQTLDSSEFEVRQLGQTMSNVPSLWAKVRVFSLYHSAPRDIG